MIDCFYRFETFPLQLAFEDQFDLATALLQIQDGADWHLNREESLEGVLKHPCSDDETEEINAASIFLSAFQSDNPKTFKQMKNFSPLALDSVRSLIKYDVKSAFLTG